MAYLHLYPDNFRAQNDPYERARQIAIAITAAVYSLGDGPYGRAAQALFGLTVETRGRMLKDRRKAAADELDLAVGTWRRYYQGDLLASLAFDLWTRRASRSDV